MRLKEAALVAAGLVLAAMGSASAADPIRIAFPTWVGDGPFYLAQDKGYFADEGVDVELQIMEDSKFIFAALAAGQVDGVVPTPNTLLLNVKPDSNVVMVMAVDDSNGADGILANKSIGSLADLKGKHVAYMEGSSPEFYLSYNLKQIGMSVDDVIKENMTAADAGAAFVANRVDAAVTWEPWLTRGKATDHGKVLVDTSSTPGIIIDVLAFRSDIVKTRGDDIRKIIRAYNRALEFYKANPEEATEIMARLTGGWLGDPTEFAGMLKTVKLFDGPENKTFVGTRDNPGQMYKTVQAAIDFWRASDKLVWPDVKPEDVIDPSFLP
jgi:NitT/TauT family transport system substrate-binding protein